MEHVSLTPAGNIGTNFIPREYLPEGEDEHYLRNTQQTRPSEQWRHLQSSELELLVKNGNYAEDWDKVLVTDPFDPQQILNSQFFGLVRIGRLEPGMLEHHDLRVMTGITNSKVIACDVGDDCAVHNVRYLAHFILGNRVVLINIDEMHTTNYAKFGNGILKEGESEEVRVWLDLMNETGGRQVLPFEEMITADAYLWAKYRDDEKLMEKLKIITQGAFDTRRGYYGIVGDQSVIKNTRIIKDVQTGSCCYIKGANKLKNLTIKSTAEEPSQIVEGVELVNGIIGLGCHIFYGCKAVRFITGNNAHLKYGARLLNSFLGDNSTVSCCEILNNLIFPAHEQHHNNSFLVASCTLGQSNIAAGATIGSNHNSRANDNEIFAGRGFWPGLCTSLKHSSRFASFVLIAKGSYPAELDIPLPFSLVNNNVTLDRLEVMPAYWWLYNLYALARNSWKYQARDKRKTKFQHIEFDCFAPDTVEEIRRACSLLARWAEDAAAPDIPPGPRNTGSVGDTAALNDTAARRRPARGHTEPSCSIDLSSPADLPPAEHTPEMELPNAPLPPKMELPLEIELPCGTLERSKRKAVLIKVREGYRAYREMLFYYAAVNILRYFEEHPDTGFERGTEELRAGFHTDWVNLGGQLVPEEDVRKIRDDIASGVLGSWKAIHERYDELWKEYPLQKQRHAFGVLRDVLAASDAAASTDSGPFTGCTGSTSTGSGTSTSGIGSPSTRSAVSSGSAASSGAASSVPTSEDPSSAGSGHRTASSVPGPHPASTLPSKKQVHEAFDRAACIQRHILAEVYASRKKDYDNPFRKMTYRNNAEMEAVAGTIDSNSFIRQVQEDTENFEKRVEAVKKRL